MLRNRSDSLRILADAVILAAGIRPLRNIEGAIEPADRVFFCQPHGEAEGTQGAEIAAAETASLVQAMFGSELTGAG